nr:fimbrial protein [Burkholderia ubonensis]
MVRKEYLNQVEFGVEVKRKHISTLLIAGSIVTIAPAAHAADGLIDFVGSLTAATCKINGGTGQNFTVNLPPVSTSALATAGSWAGRQPFSIKLSECAPDTGTVSAYLEPGPTVNSKTGRLQVDSGGAKNVEIGLLNSKFEHIAAGAALGSQNVDKVSIDSGSATLDFYAQYESLGSATAGAAKSRVNYTIVYQ